MVNCCVFGCLRSQVVCSSEPAVVVRSQLCRASVNEENRLVVSQPAVEKVWGLELVAADQTKSAVAEVPCSLFAIDHSTKVHCNLYIWQQCTCHKLCMHGLLVSISCM